MRWTFEFAHDPTQPSPFVARLRYGEVEIERRGATSTDAVMGLLRIATFIQDEGTREACISAIRQGTGRESLPRG